MLTCQPGCTLDTSECYVDRFVDNGDGTITDNQTKLMWEKKDNSDGTQDFSNPHDVDNTYAWSATDAPPDGRAFTQFLGQLNNCVSADFATVTGGFAGHCDWRLPTIGELRTILDCSFSPCIDPIFGPTAAAAYWSSTSDARSPLGAFVVFFFGTVTGDIKVDDDRARAVRSAP